MAQRRPVPIHYLRGNESEWTPPQVIFLDTETRWRQDAKGETHVMRLWAARLDSRRPDNSGWTGTVEAWGRTAGGLAAQIAEWHKGAKTVWLFAHNLSFDLTVSRLPAELGKLDYEVTDHAVGSETPWLRMSRGSGTLTMADSWGWLRMPINDLSPLVQIAKPKLPRNDATESDWVKRCEADRDILAAAMLSVLEWWDGAGLGRWSLTGSATGWNAMRHRMPRRKVTIIPDEAGIKSDRAAIYGGRRECFQWGEIKGAPFAELDFSSAYPMVAAHLPLPAKRMYGFDSLPVSHPLARGAGQGIIARVLVETSRPRYPCRAGGRVWYPVGRFWATLAGPEIAEASRLGELRAIGPGYAHALGWHLQGWANWILDCQAGVDATMPETAHQMVKHWGRACIGKFAARGFTKEPYGNALDDTWSYLPVWDIGAQSHGAVATLGGKRWKCLATVNGDNAYPAVLAYVESHVRLRLGRALDLLPAGSVIVCDTDGLIVRERETSLPGGVTTATGPLALRRKGRYKNIHVTGPRHLRKDGRRAYSGVPGSAVTMPDGTLQALVWPRMSWQMREHAGDGYRRPVQDYTIGPSYATGWVAADGAVWPAELTADDGGHNQPVPWAASSAAGRGVQLGQVQSPSILATFGMGE